MIIGGLFYNCYQVKKKDWIAKMNKLLEIVRKTKTGSPLQSTFTICKLKSQFWNTFHGKMKDKVILRLTNVKWIKVYGFKA